MVALDLICCIICPLLATYPLSLDKHIHAHTHNTFLNHVRASYTYDNFYAPMVQRISVYFFSIVPYMITTATSTSVSLTLIHYFYLLHYLYSISFPVDLLMLFIASPTLISSRPGIVLNRHVSLVPFNQKHFHSLSLSFMTLTF